MEIPEKEWTLEGSGIVIHCGDLVEYQVEGKEQLLAAIVVNVAHVGYAGFGSSWPVGTQFLSVRKIVNRRLPKPEIGRASWRERV